VVTAPIGPMPPTIAPMPTPVRATPAIAHHRVTSMASTPTTTGIGAHRLATTTATTHRRLGCASATTTSATHGCTARGSTTATTHRGSPACCASATTSATHRRFTRYPAAPTIAHHGVTSMRSATSTLYPTLASLATTASFRCAGMTHSKTHRAAACFSFMPGVTPMPAAPSFLQHGWCTPVDGLAARGRLSSRRFRTPFQASSELTTSGRDARCTRSVPAHAGLGAAALIGLERHQVLAQLCGSAVGAAAIDRGDGRYGRTVTLQTPFGRVAVALHVLAADWKCFAFGSSGHRSDRALRHQQGRSGDPRSHLDRCGTSDPTTPRPCPPKSRYRAERCFFL